MALQDTLDQGWRELLHEEFDKPYWEELEGFVAAQRAQHPGHIYPPEDKVFAAFNFAPYDQVKVLLLGQDPYHGPGQAHGLSFSVEQGVSIPPSLRNMHKELGADLGIEPPSHGSLERWAEQGVMLLNTVLTVRHKEANSHKRRGWETFTDAVIRKLNEREDPVVFVLWGGAAKKKVKLIDTERHAIVQSAHPSPLSAHRGYFGAKPYSKVNAALVEMGKQPIDWRLPA